MGTRGTIAVKYEDKTIRVYNHFDSYPTHLGREFAAFIRDSDEFELPTLIAAAVKVDESDTCPDDVLDTMKRAGIWEPVSTGTDWYSALRGAQGDFAAYLRLGYIPAWEYGDSEEWGYLADFDTQKLIVTYGGDEVGSVPFADLSDEEQARSIMASIEEKAYA